MNVLGTWTSKGLPRPSWSNSRGDVRVAPKVCNSISFLPLFEVVVSVKIPLINVVTVANKIGRDVGKGG